MTDPQPALAAFTAALSQARSETAAWAALETLTKTLVGARLFTVMTVDIEAMLARRAYTDDPVAYPTSGTKPVVIDDWFVTMRTKRALYVANDIRDVADHFPDLDLILSLGCGSVVNLPIILGDDLVATMNILDVEGHYTPDRVALIEAALTLPAMAAAAVARGF